MNFWLSDLQTALTDLERNFNCLAIIVTEINGTEDGFIFKVSTGRTIKWNRFSRQIIILKDWR